MFSLKICFSYVHANKENNDTQSFSAFILGISFVKLVKWGFHFQCRGGQLTYETCGYQKGINPHIPWHFVEENPQDRVLRPRQDLLTERLSSTILTSPSLFSCFKHPTRIQEVSLFAKMLLQYHKLKENIKRSGICRVP